MSANGRDEPLRLTGSVSFVRSKRRSTLPHPQSPEGEGDVITDPACLLARLSPAVTRPSLGVFRGSGGSSGGSGSGGLSLSLSDCFSPSAEGNESRRAKQRTDDGGPTLFDNSDCGGGGNGGNDSDRDSDG